MYYRPKKNVPEKSGRVVCLCIAPTEPRDFVRHVCPCRHDIYIRVLGIYLYIIFYTRAQYTRKRKIKKQNLIGLWVLHVVEPTVPIKFEKYERVSSINSSLIVLKPWLRFRRSLKRNIKIKKKNALYVEKFANHAKLRTSEKTWRTYIRLYSAGQREMFRKSLIVSCVSALRRMNCEISSAVCAHADTIFAYACK